MFISNAYAQAAPAAAAQRARPGAPGAAREATAYCKARPPFAWRARRRAPDRKVGAKSMAKHYCFRSCLRLPIKRQRPIDPEFQATRCACAAVAAGSRYCAISAFQRSRAGFRLRSFTWP